MPTERKAALKKLRKLGRTHLIGFASQKHFIGLYTLRVRMDVMKAHRASPNAK